MRIQGFGWLRSKNYEAPLKEAGAECLLGPPGKGWSPDMEMRLPASFSSTHPRVLDLLDLAALVYGADRLALRGRGGAWGRYLKLILPVRDSAFWRGEQRSLERLLSELSGDGIMLEFLDSEDKPAPSAPPPPITDRDIALLSGGLDSFAGAALLLEEGRTLHLIRHYTAERKTSDHTAKALERFFPSRTSYQPHRLTLSKSHGSNPPSEEPSQRLRPLLFLTLAAIEAQRLGASRIWMNENGVMSWNLPLSPARISTFSTRSTRPGFLRQMAEFLSGWAGRPMEVHNRLIGLTKQEAVHHLVEKGFGKDIEATSSCAFSQERYQGHCGKCIACLHRLLSLEPLGIRCRTDQHGLAHFTDLSPSARTQVIDWYLSAVRWAGDETLEDVMAPFRLEARNGQEVAEALALHRRYGAEVQAHAAGFGAAFPPAHPDYFRAAGEATALSGELELLARQIAGSLGKSFSQEEGVEVLSWWNERYWCLLRRLLAGQESTTSLKELGAKSLQRALGLWAQGGRSLTDILAGESR